MKQKEIKLKGKDGNTYGIKFDNIDTLKKEIENKKKFTIKEQTFQDEKKITLERLKDLPDDKKISIG